MHCVLLTGLGSVGSGQWVLTIILGGGGPRLTFAVAWKLEMEDEVLPGSFSTLYQASKCRQPKIHHHVDCRLRSPRTHTKRDVDVVVVNN